MTIIFSCFYVMQFGSTPLCLAAMYGGQDIVDMLLSNGARTDCVDKVRYFITI